MPNTKLTPKGLPKTFKILPKRRNFATSGHNVIELPHKSYLIIIQGICSRLLTLQGFSWFPVFREIYLSSGSCAATKKGMESLLW